MGLTKHPEGSVRELWAISFPLMLSSLSVTSMLFVDRIFLAKYSTEALMACVTAATVGWAFLFGAMVMASIAEVFVAQYNGAGILKKLGEPVWQMIWFSLLSFVIFVPLGLYGGYWLFIDCPHLQLELDYFKWMMILGPFFSLYNALSGFFIGQGKTYLVTLIAIVANIVNAGLDYLLIFGIDGYFPSMGIEGAAIATGGSAIFQVIILWVIFLNRKNRSQYGTGYFRLNPELFWKCVKIGAPGAIFVSVEIFGWAAYYEMMTGMGERHIIIAGICQSISILCYFFAEGISKGTSTIVGNLIGAKKHHQVSQVLQAGILLHVVFCLGMILTFFIADEYLLKMFMPNASSEIVRSINGTLFTCLIAVALYLFFEGIRWLISGILTAAGDTLFLMIAGSCSVWLMFVLPIYLLVVLTGAKVEMALYLGVVYSICVVLLYYWRFVGGKWKEKVLISKETFEVA